MQVRYLGFEQQQNARSYRFDVAEKDGPSRTVVVTADLGLFLTHRVGIQEGPTLSANKLTADLERSFEGEHELTDGDLRACAKARVEAETRRVESRRSAGRRSGSAGKPAEHSPWRGLDA